MNDMASSGGSLGGDISGQEASDILASALQQMDTIIANTKFDSGTGSNAGDGAAKGRGEQMAHSRVIKLVDELRVALELCEDQATIVRKLPTDLLDTVLSWLDTGRQQLSASMHETSGERAERLDRDRSSLMVQLTVLSEQVEGQGEKLRCMEYELEDKRHKLHNAEETLHKELLTRSSLETHKVDLMTEITSLKIRLATVENERREIEERLIHSQRQITDLEARLALKDAETADLRQRLARNGTVTSDVNEYEVERLKKAVDALVTSNAEKEKRIEELRRLLRRYKKIEELVAQAQGRKVLDEILGQEDDTSSTSSTTPSVTVDTTRTTDTYTLMGEESKDKTYNMSPTATSTPVSVFPSAGNLTSPPSTIASVKPTRRIQRSNSAEDIATVKSNHKTPPSTKRHTDVVKRNGSYAQVEVMTDEEDGPRTLYHHPVEKKKKGIFRFFGRLKRSGSQDFHERERSDEFKRGGIRATATARLGWSRDIKKDFDASVPFSRWDKDRIVSWFNEIGLNMYLAEVRRWCRHGEQLLKASPHELDKELNMRNGLHRKKLQLAIQALSSGSGSNKAGDLDHTWVMRWLDDIGLPQYKDSFFDARIDGRMLHALTVEDLLSLKVTNELHHLSIKRGIQILRLHNYNPHCLVRRPSPDEGALHDVPADVALWTNHRVMEWLRTIDLSEYAPNLRGSGVHGALMVLESRFNAELFALILSIPQNKTLLRRHLSTHFVSLIGNEVQIKKREQESSAGYIPLAPNAKVKKGKFGLFGHKRTKSDSESEGFVCPLDLALPLDKLKSTAVQYQEREQDGKRAKEIGAYSKEITSLTSQLGQESFFDSVPSSNV